MRRLLILLVLVGTAASAQLPGLSRRTAPPPPPLVLGIDALRADFIAQAGSDKIYFGGDSGYGRHYRQIAELFPKLDYFLVGIGSYEPRWFMEPSHNNPADAVHAFIDSGARFLVPMHYGTFDLTDEPPSQPLRFLMEEAEKDGIEAKVKPLAINEAILFEAAADD